MTLALDADDILVGTAAALGVRGHVVVTLVAVGLIVWLLGRDAHWLSDVVAGVAVGILWLNVVVMAASRPTARRHLALTPGESR